MKNIWIIQYGQLGVEDSPIFSNRKKVLESFNFVYGEDTSVKIITSKNMVIAMRDNEQLSIAFKRKVN